MNTKGITDFCKVCENTSMFIIKTENQFKERQDKVKEFDKIKKRVLKLETDNQSLKFSNSKVGKHLEEIKQGRLPDALITRIGKYIENVTKNVTSDLCTEK